MNAVEHIVEAYYRLCLNCFTRSDVKVICGNNRQLDLLAINLVDGTQYHIESSVTHALSFAFHTKHLKEMFNKKFRGFPAERAGENADFAKGRNYEKEIRDTYQSVGFSPEKLQRVWCGWIVADYKNLNQFLADYKQETGLAVSVISFRDEVIPKLQATVATSNYDDEVLRTLSLLQQRQVQVKCSETKPANE